MLVEGEVAELLPFEVEVGLLFAPVDDGDGVFVGAFEGADGFGEV